jgi:7-cyano-7-deazaguanine tRNA-ribosyltransferase
VTKKSAFFYSGIESLKRPEVLRHLRRLKGIKFKAKTLVLLPDAKKPYSKTYGVSSGKEYHICVVSPVFGIIPLEVEEVYPLNQHEGPKVIEREQLNFVTSIVEDYAKNFERVFIHKDLGFLMISGTAFDNIKIFSDSDVKIKLMAIADYQFGKDAGNILFEGDIEVEWARTGRIRRVYSGDALLATLRASDGSLILTIKGAKRLLRLEYPKNRVVVSKEISKFIREGKSIFAKFVIDCDKEIRPSQEVIVVDSEDDLLATGRAILNGEEMLAFGRGIAVKTRHKVDEGEE